LLNPKQPDWVWFGLRPLGKAGGSDIARVARILHGFLETLGLQSLPVYPGETGLDLFVPVTGPVLQVEIARFARKVASAMATQLSECVETPEPTRARRVYVDVRGNEVGGTVLAPYLPRAEPGATVVTPLSWDEVGPKLSPRAFTLQAVLQRLERSGDPLQAWLTTRQQLPRIA
jgi:bifunctional non-homologous end joining protein LigD